MIPGALFAMVAATAAAPSPEPSPSPMHQIGHVRSSALCGSLSSLILPVAEKVEANDRDFRALGTALARFGAGKGIAFDPQLNPVLAADPTLPSDTDVEGNDQNVYTPERTMAASNIDRLSQEVITTIIYAEREIGASMRAHPDSADPALAALRRRVENVVSLQRLLAFRLGDIAGEYFSGGAAAPSAGDRTAQSAFERSLETSIDDQAVQDVDAGDSSTATSTSADIREFAGAGPAQLAMELRVQKAVLSRDVERVAAGCDAPLAAPSPP